MYTLLHVVNTWGKFPTGKTPNVFQISMKMTPMCISVMLERFPIC